MSQIPTPWFMRQPGQARVVVLGDGDAPMRGRWPTEDSIIAQQPGGRRVFGPPNSKRVAREFSPRGIEARIFYLRDMIKKSLLDVEISRGLALGVTGACPERNDLCELEAIWHFVHATNPDGTKNIRYTGDINGYDTFQTARATLQFRGGDCDDLTVLLITLAMGNGFAAKARITRNEKGGQWAHIYPLIGYPKGQPDRWIPFDATLGYAAFARHPPQAGHVEFDGENIVYGPNEINPDADRDGGYGGW